VDTREQQKMALSSRQKPRFLTAATEPMSAKVPQATFAQALSSRQKPRFLTAATEPMSAKVPQATFAH
jgi:hypothetical protein